MSNTLGELKLNYNDIRELLNEENYNVIFYVKRFYYTEA